jgi:hypothetical protein
LASAAPSLRAWSKLMCGGSGGTSGSVIASRTNGTSLANARWAGTEIVWTYSLATSLNKKLRSTSCW